jgi:hypothetical protein
MFYTSQPEELRAFLRDKLGFPASDVGGGWLVFDLPEADMGCHPAEVEKGAPSGTHNISFYCDDLNKTVAELLHEAKVKVHRTIVGEYMTSLEMAGCSVTVLRLDDELKALLEAPAETPAFRQGR